MQGDVTTGGTGVNITSGWSAAVQLGNADGLEQPLSPELVRRACPRCLLVPGTQVIVLEEISLGGFFPGSLWPSTQTLLQPGELTGIPKEGILNILQSEW